MVDPSIICCAEIGISTWLTQVLYAYFSTTYNTWIRHVEIPISAQHIILGSDM
jgi:hypothetical protein